MRISLPLFVLLIAFGCQTNPKEDTTESIITSNDQKILRNLKEIQWPKAYREQDTVLLDNILGDDFQMVDADGNWSNKNKELEWIKEHAMQHDSFYYEIKRLDILDNGTAMICGTGHILNDSTETIYQSSNVLIKRNGAWKAIASHVSGIKKLDE
ncbi:nuclear transport factor 2 family protein [Flagellimonas hymeniacidonis]|uniref:Nuclear transport factor 2 family protein n=1 Tax=Flagellimonas hymeniacidonis TaxID=2603628 RepID=A0A5C8V752_9FLAO|nr:nuclear transport factor 2 family protein [Flagellimonas hymeniacidonis]TXN37487.1 nuclear transport factor 2 family protein [Flagellimonas hymeniacidonis]